LTSARAVSIGRKIPARDLPTTTLPYVDLLWIAGTAPNQHTAD
jgi:hypothetical protein